MFRLLADLVVLVHLAFVVFVVAGGLLVWRRPRWLWLHLPAAAWGAVVELGGFVCPLTPLERALRRRAGEAPYGGSFVEEYVLPLLYPVGLTRELQWVLGAGVLAVNGLVYGLLWRRWRARPRSRSGSISARGHP